MSYLDRLVEANRHDLAAYRPWRVAGQPVGWVRHAFAERLARWPEVFAVGDAELRLAPALDEAAVPAAERSLAVGEVLRALHAAGLLCAWRDELYPVAPGREHAPLLLMERAALPLFGVTGYGVHLNGVVRDARGRVTHLWVARRAADKPTFPGQLDQLVAGGQPAGIGVLDNLVKECREEAGIDAALARRARPVSVVRYCHETAEGLRPDVVYCYDLDLAAHFVPVNRDGEVAEFLCWSVARVMRTVRDTREFKFNCALVVIDWLVRRGFLGPDLPGYLELVSGLHHPPAELSAAR